MVPMIRVILAVTLVVTMCCAGFAGHATCETAVVPAPAPVQVMAAPIAPVVVPAAPLVVAVPQVQLQTECVTQYQTTAVMAAPTVAVAQYATVAVPSRAEVRQAKRDARRAARQAPVVMSVPVAAAPVAMVGYAPQAAVGVQCDGLEQQE